MVRPQRSGYKPEKKEQPTGNLNGFQRWNQLNSVRKGFLRRCEEYAAMTIPKECLPNGVNQNSQSIQHDWSSVGAQLVNHLTNKLVTALFSPGMPFFRLDPNDRMEKMLKEAGVEDKDMRGSLVAGETKALKVMDQKAIRPKLHETCRGLIITGNRLLDLLDPDNPRSIGIKDYCVKRSMAGKPQEILHYERLLWDELTEDAQAASPSKPKGEEGYVDYVRWFRKEKGKWKLYVSINGQDLGEEFRDSWDEGKFPLYPLCWDLADKHNYGTGLVEDYSGDFGVLSTLTESELKAAILASDFRWLANPAGVGDIEEFKESQTGDVIPGVAEDLSLVAHVSTNALQMIGASAERVVQRLGRAFLLGSSMTRDAERVTAEEIRLQANELETSLGGVYSRLAVDMQLPIAIWLLKQIKVDIQGTDLVPTIVTGIAALSRNAEAQQLIMALSSLQAVAQVPPAMLDRLKLSAIISTLFSAHGIVADDYVLSEEEYTKLVQQREAAAQEQAAQQMMNQAGAKRLEQGAQQ